MHQQIKIDVHLYIVYVIWINKYKKNKIKDVIKKINKIIIFKLLLLNMIIKHKK